MSAMDHNPYAAPQALPEPAAAADLGSPVVLSGDVGLDIHLRAHALASGKVRLGWQFLATLALIVAVITLNAFLVLQTAREGENHFAWLAAMVGCLAVFAVPWLFYFFVRRLGPWQLRRAFAKGQLKPDHATWTITDDGIHAVTDTIDSKEKWANYESWKASDDMILLYAHSGATCIPLAREFCTSQDDWHRLREFLRVKLPEKKE